MGAATPPAEDAWRARLLQGLHLELRRLDVDGIATTVLEGGDGPSLVLLHGGIECGGVYWAPVVAALAERHHLVMPDVPGLGASGPAPRLDPDAFDRWFAELLRLMCPAAPVVVAHSLLGSFAVRFAVSHRALLQQLVVYAAPGVGPYRMPMGLRVVAVRFAVRPTARNAERFERFALLDLDATRRRDPEWYDAFSAYTTARAKDRHAKATMRQLIRAGTKQVPDAELRTIDVPTALLWGRDDRMAPLQLAEGVATRLGWPLYIVDGAAHVPHIEQPGSFLSALSDATRRPSTRSTS